LFVLAFVEIPYLNPHGGMRPHHLEIRWLLLPHLLARIRCPVVGAGAVLQPVFAGVSQGASGYSVASMLDSVLIAAPLAMSIPIYLGQDLFYIAGTIAHAGTWFVPQHWSPF